MVITEAYRTRKDGVVLVKTYSDEGKLLVQDTGIVYEGPVVDVQGKHTYTESDEYAPSEEISDSEALAIITGGASDDQEQS